MPKKKKVSELPPISGSTPPWSARSARSSTKAEFDEPLKDNQRHMFLRMESRDLSQTYGGEVPLHLYSSSMPSTAASLGMSRDEARGMSLMLDDSLQSTSGVRSFSAAPKDVDAGDQWEVQNVDEILDEVKQCVYERKPWRQMLDDSVLDHRHNERLDREQRGFHIILPDNRVRVMEDELSFRVRSQLLESEDVTPDPPPMPRRPDKNKMKNQRMRMNPWYLKPKSWYKDKLKAENDEESNNNFPYADVVLNLPPGAQVDESSSAQVLTTHQKENLDIYKLYVKDLHMKGFRLPHFLQ